MYKITLCPSARVHINPITFCEICEENRRILRNNIIFLLLKKIEIWWARASLLLYLSQQEKMFAYVELFSFQAMHANLLEKKDHTMLNMSYTLAHKRLKHYVSDLRGILHQNDEVCRWRWQIKQNAWILKLVTNRISGSFISKICNI